MATGSVTQDKNIVYRTYQLAANSSCKLTLTNRKPYILAVSGNAANLQGLYIGIGYGKETSRHKIVKILEASDITVAPDNDKYGLVITSTSANAVDLTIMLTDKWNEFVSS